MSTETVIEYLEGNAGELVFPESITDEDEATLTTKIVELADSFKTGTGDANRGVRDEDLRVSEGYDMGAATPAFARIGNVVKQLRPEAVMEVWNKVSSTGLPQAALLHKYVAKHMLANVLPHHPATKDMFDGDEE